MICTFNPIEILHVYSLYLFMFYLVNINIDPVIPVSNDYVPVLYQRKKYIAMPTLDDFQKFYTDPYIQSILKKPRYTDPRFSTGKTAGYNWNNKMYKKKQFSLIFISDIYVIL